ncbi:YjbH domain-containing protein [Halotalea alkalilenta]|uniref:YjbH domain-containing protein n=1 Tax=Halotalea alkalilenta TaxID=376489 RepID=UPI001FDF26C9|nr:YjbH domain-containing protein [Halotalea alkalilenta]
MNTPHSVRATTMSPPRPVRTRLACAVRAILARRRPLLPPMAGVMLAMSCAAQAQQDLPKQDNLGSSQSDFGGVGLMQTPTARFAPLGNAAFTYSRASPYRRYNFSFQPTSWMEAGFRYTEIENRSYGAVARDRNYLDRGFDIKLKLSDESRYWPALAVGARDIGGTGLFSAEYLVASKRWYDFDFTLGMGWGYLGNSGDFSSPFGWASDRFDNRPGRESTSAGDFNLDQLFRGDVALFGGIEYQTPWDPLVLQLEYEGNDYQNEPNPNSSLPNNNQPRDSRVNIGARYHVNDNLALNVGYQRGNTLMAGVTLSANLGGLAQIKFDPEPVPLEDEPPVTHTEDWSEVRRQLAANAGIKVYRVVEQGNTLLVEGEPTTYRSMPEAEGRANRILHNAAGRDITTFRYRWYSEGVAIREDVQPRQAFVDAVASEDANIDYRHSIYSLAATGRPAKGEVLDEPSYPRFNYDIGPGLQQNVGGPDGYLYQVTANLAASYRTDRNGWFSGLVAYNLFDNYDRAEYSTSSRLPRVRSDIDRYVQESDFSVRNLQYTRTAQLGDDWYAMAYGGLLETMYSGAGGELMYRPFNTPLAFGMDLNWVKQRDFDGGFGTRDYDVWTGHITGYWETGFEDVLAKLSVGRYLAGDVGATLDLSRQFASGVRLGAWATRTDAGDDYGEGSFDKGIYVTIPLDAFFVKSSRNQVGLAWQPLIRDGGARLGRAYSLYDLTSERWMGNYWNQTPDALKP